MTNGRKLGKVCFMSGVRAYCFEVQGDCSAFISALKIAVKPVGCSNALDLRYYRWGKTI